MIFDPIQKRGDWNFGKPQAQTLCFAYYKLYFICYFKQGSKFHKIFFGVFFLPTYVFYHTLYEQLSSSV